MPERPFDVIDCSWPRPVECSAGWWASEPHWDAPLSMMTPQPNWQMLQGHLCWSIDWRAFFRAGIVPWERDFGGEMRGFHVVFRIRVNHAGKLAFWADDGCMIRRNGEILNEDRSAHTPLRREVDVECGDVLQIAQWQKDGEWVWGAEPLSGSGAEPTMDCLWPYYEAVLQKIQAPNGPPLKMYSHAVMPFRMILSAYSLILNGYVPSDVLLYGEHQWSGGARHILSSFVPFANIVSTDEVNANPRLWGRRSCRQGDAELVGDEDLGEPSVPT